MSFILLGILNSQVEATAAGAFDLLETTLISSNTASVTFSNLNTYTEYKHLQLRYTARSTVGDYNANLWLRLNGDTGANYGTHTLFGNGSSVTSTSDTARNEMRFTFALSGSLESANNFGAGVIDILDFSSSSKNTTSRAMFGTPYTGNTDRRIALASGLWLNTAAVTSLTVLTVAQQFVSGSRFSLYGVK